MQTTVKHGPKQLVIYVGFGDSAVEIGLRPWRFVRHTKRTQLSRSAKKKLKGAATDYAARVTDTTLPGFTEPEHPPQTSTALGK